MVIEGEDYESSMEDAERDAKINGWELLSEDTRDGCEGAIGVREDYLGMSYEGTKEQDGGVLMQV